MDISESILQYLVTSGFNVLRLMEMVSVRISQLSPQALPTLARDITKMKQYLGGLDIKTPQVTLLYKDLGITPKSSYDLTDFQLPSKNISAKGTQHELESPFLYGADKYIVEEFQTVVDNMIQNHPSSFPKKIS